MAKVVIISKTKEKSEMVIPTDTDIIQIALEGVALEITPPSNDYPGHIVITVDKEHLPNYDMVPDVGLSVGASDSKGPRWCVCAVLHITDSGRIVGQNTTPGFAPIEKPLATRPWTRRDI